MHIIEPATAKATSSEQLDWSTYTITDPDSPLLSWGINFPIWDTGLETCTAPS